MVENLYQFMRRHAPIEALARVYAPGAAEELANAAVKVLDRQPLSVYQRFYQLPPKEYHAPVHRSDAFHASGPYPGRDL